MKCIVLFSKAPVPGKVKTRLVPPLNHNEAASLQKSFVFDTLTTLLAKENHKVFLACHPSSEHPFFKSLKKRYPLTLINQGAGNLGDRMKRTILLLRSKKYSKIIIVGSDSPTLPCQYIGDGFDKLDKNDLVIGPSIDGGYYLLGVKGDIPDIFDRIPWGSDAVFEETMVRARGSAIKTSVLPFWYDIDTIKELRFLVVHLASIPENQSVFTRNTIEDLKMQISVRL